jgi:hypothetical protein
LRQVFTWAALGQHAQIGDSNLSLDSAKQLEGMTMFDLNSRPARNPLIALVQTALVFLFAVSSAHAGVVLLELTVTSNADSGPGSLRDAVNAASTNQSIAFDCSTGALNCPATIQLSSQGNAQGFPGPTALAIKGKAITIKGPPGGVTLKTVPGVSSATSLRHFFVDSDASLTLQNVLLSDGLALGGDGGAGDCGGGGGAGLGGAIFSQGALTLKDVSFANNSAIAGNGGSASSSNEGYGGGGGLGGDGGSQNNGGGGGTGGDGLTGSGGLGGMGGAGLFGDGAGMGSDGDGGQGISGGGGGGGYNLGGAGSDGGGGGGGASGGVGGFGGGGGGARNSGIGGFGGGGGTDGVSGGVGGGGGSCLQNTGFGGGAAAFGGAVFVRSGGALRVEETSGTSYMLGNSVSGGNGTFSGAATGSGIFLMSGVPAVFDIAGSYTIDNDIADDSVVSLPAGQSYTPGTGNGAGITKQGIGTLTIAGAGHYAGATNVQDGVLRVIGNISASAINIAASGIFAGTGTTGPIDAYGTVAPGTVANPEVNLTPSSLKLEHGALSCFHVSGNSVSELDVQGAAQLNGIVHIDFAGGPPVGQTFTLLQASSIAATFAGYETNMPNLYGKLEYTGTTVTFTIANSDELFDGGMENPVIESPCATAFAN